jgi:hypothetical protein
MAKSRFRFHLIDLVMMVVFGGIVAGVYRGWSELKTML